MKKHFLKLVIAVCALTGASPAQAQSIYEPYSFTTLAGLALNSGATDDTGSLARFNQPWGVAVDSAGNVYVAEALNQTIRKITPGGVVTTLAGVAGSPGFNDGPANAALFSRPTGVAVNSAGTVVYVADRNNHIIRKISGGFVTTLAGSAGVFGSADGTGPAAQFHYPNGVAVDSADNVYVADTFNETIRKITPGGGVTTLAGSVGVFGSANGPGTAAQFGAPEGIAVDESGNVYVADIASATIRKIAFNGWVSTLAGSAGSSGFTDGVGSAARFSMAELTIVTGVPGVAVDSCGNVYVADGGNDLIRKITPGGSVTTLGGLALTSGSNDDTGSAARFYFPAGVAVDGAGNVYVADTLNHTIRLGVNTNTNASPNCDTNTSNCPEGAPLDANGNLVVPEGMDTNLITYVEVNRLLGTVEQLNPGFDTSVDLWYTNLNCLQSIGGTVPTNASNPDFTSILAGIGITNVSPAQISITISNWNVQIASQAVSETLSFPTAGPVGPPYFPPATPHCPDPTKKYAFGGRDIVFVHGLQLGHVFDKIAGNPHAMQTWVTPTQFPGSAQNPEFYDGGYFKSVADDVWYVHLIKFLLMNGYQNRYLIVDYPCTERLEVGAQAVLTQISDAMHFGTGVKSIGQLLDPNGAYDTSNFGTPSFVVVSHSTGTLLTDVAMTAAARYPNLGAGYIPQMCKAHVAMDGVFSGSELATAAIAISGFATVSPADWGCSMAAAALSLFDPSYPAVDCNFLSVFSSSILVDLVPLVSQYKWGSFVDATPVRTLTLVGGHPTFLWPLKYLINPGFDDGVTTINSQVANPNSRFFWPSGFRPQGSGLIGPFDMGLAGTGNGQQSGLMSPARAVGYYIDQVAEPGRLPPLLIAGGATPYLSPSGMRQDVADDYAGTPFSTLNRYHNHFSFIQSASDHLGGYTGTLGFFGSDYFPTPIGEANQEESRVITDPAVYVPFSMVYPGDDAPLLDRSCVPKVESWERGRMIPAIHFSFFGHHYTWGPWWIWRRVYDLLEGWQTKMGCDYMYESVLQCPPLQSCATCIAPPANLALWLPFDEASGSTARNLAGGSDGVLYNGSTVATSANGPIHEVSDPTHITPTGGFNGGSLYFDGIDDNVVVPSYNGINVGAGDFTLGAWVNRDPNSGASSIRVIVDKREPGTGIGYSFVVDSGNLLLQMTSTAGNFANYSDTNAVPVDNQWHFVAVTVSRGPTNSVVRFYLDGAPTAILNTAALPGSLDNTTPLQVGSSLVPGVDAWMGGIDEVVLFTRALTALEIQGLSNAGSVGQCKTPLLSSLVLNCATGKVVPCGTPWSFDAPTASDTCSPTNVTIIILSTETNGVCPQFITRTWMATDACTNSATCSQTVMVVDTAPPVLTCATNKTVNCGTAWTFDAPTASDSCSGTNVTLTILSTVTNGVCPQLITRTWMATDACTNSVTCAQTVTVVNTSLPVILCPSNIVVASCTVTQLFYTATATDACNGNLTVVCTPPSGSAFAPGTTNTVTCVASNCIGSASCSFTITVGCSTNPCPNLVVNGSFEATSPAMSPNTFNNALNPTTGVPGWTTASTNFLEIWCNNAGFPASRGTNQLEINAQSDDETVSQVVTGLSTNCAATFCFDYTGRFGLAGGTPNNDFTVTLSSGDILFSVPLDPAASATGGWMSFCTNFVPTASTVTIAFRGHPHFSDGTSATQGGAHIDNVSLTQCCDTNPCITLTCSSDKTVQCGSAWDFDAPTNIVDNCCTNYSVTFSTVTNGLCPLVITRTWLISDICGNSNTCSQVVTVVDTTPPVITCASNKIVECGTMWSFDLPAAVDACSGTNVTLTILSTVTNGLCPLVITQTWQASDTCGNSATCSQTVTVNPAGQCVAGETWTPRQSIHDAPSVASSADGTKLVAADSQGQIYTSTDSGVNWTPRESYRTWYSVASSADGSKLVAVVNAGQVFTSIDSGTNWTAQASGSRNWQAVASSADGSKLVAVVGGGLIYTSIDSGTNWAAQASGSGNWYSVASSSDGSKLVAVVSGGLIFTSIDSGTNWTAQASGSPSWHGVASSSDGSKLVAVAYNDQIYTSTDSGTNWTARESSRNWSGVASSSDGSKLVAVVDGGQVYTSIDSGTNWMARDSNRYWWSVTSSADGSKLVAGVTDSKIYTSACTPTPVITCATDKTVNCGTAWSFDPPTIVNGCSGTNNITLTVLGTVTNGVCPQVITRTWMAMDACTNSTTCSQTVTVVDTTPPVLTCATNKTVNCGTAWTFDAPTANDSCSGTKVTLTVLSTVTNGVCPQVITRTWMATDACSNTATCSQTVTVVDTTPPVLTCATNKTVNCSTPWTFDAPTASDSCSGTKVTITILSTVTNGICPMVITRTWQATDACSNTATCSQTVTVVNTSSPVILCPSNIVVTSCTVTQLFYTATATDACNGNLAVVCTPPSGSDFTPGTTTTVLCVASNCIGSAKCSFTVTVQCPANPCVPAPANMVLWLPFDETSGTNSANLVPGGNNGTQVNGPVVTSGFVANSLTFDGVSQYVEVPSYNAINFGTNDFSIDAWVRRATTSGNSPPRIIVDKRDPQTIIGYSLAVSYGNLLFQMGGPASSYTNFRDTSILPADDQWHFVAVTVNRNSTNGGRFYIDGNPTGTFDPTAHPDNLDNTNSFVVGNTPVGGAAPWLGGIDEVEMFNRTLKTDEIAAVFNAGSAGKCKCVPAPANMVLWLPFDETSGTNSANLVPGGNNGTQVNGPVVTSGFVANSLTFDGVSQYVEVPSYNAINFGTNDFSIDAWVRRATTSGNSPPRIIVDKRDPQTIIGYSLAVSYGNLLFQMGGPASSYTNFRDTSILPADDQWHFVAVTVNRNSTNGGRFYIDGNPTGTFDPTAHPDNLDNTNSFVVGNTPVGGAAPWLGGIDEVEMFSRALKTDEIAAIFNAGPAGKCKTPCAIPLVVNCATNKTVECGSAWKFDLPTATSCCSTNVTITSSGLVTNGVCPKYITQSWLITDACGNSSTCSQTVTVRDTLPPVITCLTNKIIVALDANCQLEIPTIHPPATDDCTPTSQLVYSQDPPAGTIEPGPCHIVVVTVTDACGNNTKCQVQVCGQDKTPPTLIYPKAVTVTNCFVPDMLALVSAYDNCTASNKLVFTQSPPAGTPIAAGGSQVSVTVTDQAGNASTYVIPLISSGPHSFLDVLFNTAVDNSKVVLPGGAVDPHFTLGPVPVGTPTGPGLYNAPAAIVGPMPWLPTGFSKWISPNGHWIQFPDGFYTYTNHFTLPSWADPVTASISGRWAADTGAEMYFNGSLMPVSSIPTPAFASFFPYWTYFTIPSGFLGFPAVNQLSFVVHSTEGFTALRVEFTNAVINCSTCTPPAIVHTTPNQSLPLNSTAVFGVSVWGTPPCTLQWYHNSLPLTNSSHYSGVNTPTLTITPLSYADAGTYYAVVSNACGETHSVPAKLMVTHGWPWWWAWWNFAQIGNPMKATVGPDLIMTGTNIFGVSSGTTLDFGLPNIDGQIANVMDVPPLPGDTFIQLPFVGPPGSNSVNSYTIILDLYEPDTSFGTASTLFQSGVFGSINADGVALTLDPQNNLHLSGSAAGVPFDTASVATLPTNAWNRVALVTDDPQDGIGVNLSLYLNGQSVVGLTVPTPDGIRLEWFSSNSPTVLSRQTNGLALNGEFYVSSIQFHAVALAPEMLAGIGSPDTGPAPANDTSAGSQPVLSATVSNGIVSFSWTGGPFTLQETADLTSGVWVDSALAFTESQVNGDTLTTATADPVAEGPRKFYRLIFRP